jgi:hypothetical protein
MVMVLVMVPVLASLSVSVSVDKGRGDHTDKDRWERLRYNRGHHHPRSGSLASHGQWTCRDLELVPVLVLVA